MLKLVAEVPKFGISSPTFNKQEEILKTQDRHLKNARSEIGQWVREQSRFGYRSKTWAGKALWQRRYVRALRRHATAVIEEELASMEAPYPHPLCPAPSREPPPSAPSARDIQRGRDALTISKFKIFQKSWKIRLDGQTDVQFVNNMAMVSMDGEWLNFNMGWACYHRSCGNKDAAKYFMRAAIALYGEQYDTLPNYYKGVLLR